MPTDPEAVSGDPISFEVSPGQLELILQPDEVLAVERLDREIQAAEANPRTDPEQLTLIRFQRSVLDEEARGVDGLVGAAVHRFIIENPQHGSVAHTGGQRAMQPRPDANPALFISAIANEERWQMLGFDPMARYVGDLRARNMKMVEDIWRQAREARQASQEAQAREAEIMERARRPFAVESHDEAQAKSG